MSKNIADLENRLSRLENIISSIATLDFSPRINTTHKDELTVVEKAIDELQEELNKQLHKLTNNEKRYRVLYETSRDAIMTLAPPNWKFTSGNQATIELFNAKSEADFINYGPKDTSPKHQPDGQLSANKAKEEIMKAMETGSNFFEWTHKKLSGEEFPATVLLTKMKYNGQPLLQATVRDITNEKETAFKLEEQKKNLQKIFRAAPVAMLLLDENMVIVQVNGLVCRMVLRNSSEIIGATGGEGLGCIHSTEDPLGCGHSTSCAVCALRNGIASVLKQETSVHNYEFQLTFLIEGKKISPWLSASAEPVILDDKKHVIVAIVDITESKDAKEKLLESLNESKRLNNLTLGREKRVIEMKKEVNSLLTKLNQPIRYKSVVEQPNSE